MKLNEFDDQVPDPKRVARAWYNAVPKRTNYINVPFAKKLAILLTNYDDHFRATAMVLLGSKDSTISVIPANSSIYGTALTSEAKSLETPTRRLMNIYAGIVLTKESNVDFGFLNSSDEGYITMFIPPFLDFTKEDRLQIFSACLHEARHAYDFLIGKMEDIMGTANLPLDQYLTSSSEMRAFSEQILQLIDFCCIQHKMDWEEMKDLIIGINSGSSQFSATNRVAVIAAYLDLLRDRHHAMGKWNTASEGVVTMPQQTVQEYAREIRERIEKALDRIEQNGRRFMSDLTARNAKNSPDRN